MQLNSAELPTRLQTGLPNLVWISGDDPLLTLEASDDILKKAKAEQFNEKEQLVIEGNFKWDNLFLASNSTSLFSDKKILDVQLNTFKLGRDGSKKIQEWLSILDEDTFVLIRSAKVDLATKKTKWFQALEQKGWHIPFWPIDLKQLPRWIVERGRRHRLHFEAEAAEFLALKVESNLLAARQEVEKISLIHPANSTITLETLQNSVHDSSHYDVFKLADSALASPFSRSLKIFRSLIGEGIAIQVILWALIRDLRELTVMQSSKKNINACQPLDYVHPMIWKNRLPLFGQCLKNAPAQKFAHLLHDALLIDQASKGMSKNNELEMTERLLIALAAP